MYRFQLLQVIDQHPEVLDLLVELGFKPLANPIMHQYSWAQGFFKTRIKIRRYSYGKIVRTLEANGYEVVGLD